MRSLVILLGAASLAVVLACSEDPAASPGDPGSPDSGSVPGEGEDAAAAGPDAGADAPVTTNSTSVEAKMNDVTRTLDRAQFGTTKEGATSTLYVEAHEGGVAECPEKETPKRTLIVSGVPRGEPGTSFTKADGISVSFLDFAGDQITSGKPVTTATAATVTLIAIDDETSVDIEVEATFAEGTVRGRVYATYCAAMNEG